MQIATLVVVLSLILCGCSSNSDANSQHLSSQQAAVTAVATPNPFETQREAEAEAAAVKALGGDPDAAFALAFYFSAERFDRERSDYWMRIAEENRHAEALYYYGERLSVSEDPCTVLRAIYFLGLALEVTPESNTQKSTSLRAEIARNKERLAKMPGSNCLRADAIPH